MSWTTEIFIKRAREIHGDRYEYSKVAYVSSAKKVSIKCKEHGEFEQTPNKHLRGQGCRSCGYKALSDMKNISFEEFVNRSITKYGDRYVYNRGSYKSITSKVKITCKIHGEFEAVARDHYMSEQGCKECGKLASATSRTLTTEKFIELSKEKHGNLYDYSKSIYKHALERITIICKVHGAFQQIASTHYNTGSGCKKCADKKTTDAQRKPLEEINNLIKAVWKDEYDLSLIEYKNNNTKVKIVCKHHGIFNKIPNELIHGSGCPNCRSNAYSRIGIQWLNYKKLQDKYNIQYSGNPENNGEHKIKSSNYYADGYCKETNTIYEFQGSYWHGDPRVYDSNRLNKVINLTFGELYQRTLKKVEHCKKEGYNVIECWEYDWRRGIKAVKKIQRIFCKRKLAS